MQPRKLFTPLCFSASAVSSMQRQFNFLIDRKCRPICPPASERERFRSAAGPSCEPKTNNMLTRRNQRHRDKYKLKAPSSPQQIRYKIVKTSSDLPTAPYPSCHVNLCLPASCSEGDVGARLFFLLRPGALSKAPFFAPSIHSPLLLLPFRASGEMKSPDARAEKARHNEAHLSHSTLFRRI